MEAKYYLAFSASLIILVMRWWKRMPADEYPWKTIVADVLLAIIVGVMTYLFLEGVGVQASFEIKVDDLKEGSRFLLGVLALVLTMVVAVATMTIKIARDAVDDFHRTTEGLEKRTDKQHQEFREQADKLSKELEQKVHVFKGEFDTLQKRSDELGKSANQRINKQADEFNALQERLGKLDKKTNQKFFAIQRMLLYLDTVSRQMDARHKIEDGNKKSHLDITSLEPLVYFYETEDENQFQAGLEMLIQEHQARKQITHEGWNYINQIEKNYKREREESPRQHENCWTCGKLSKQAGYNGSRTTLADTQMWIEIHSSKLKT